MMFIFMTIKFIVLSYNDIEISGSNDQTVRFKIQISQLPISFLEINDNIKTDIFNKNYVNVHHVGFTLEQHKTIASGNFINFVL